jgi:hypothetical protein
MPTSSSSVPTFGCSCYAPSPTPLSSPPTQVVAKRYRETRSADGNAIKPCIRLIATMNLCPCVVRCARVSEPGV